MSSGSMSSNPLLPEGGMPTWFFMDETLLQITEHCRWLTSMLEYRAEELKTGFIKIILARTDSDSEWLSHHTLAVRPVGSLEQL